MAWQLAKAVNSQHKEQVLMILFIFPSQPMQLEIALEEEV
jgi:hypothetical protein